MKNEINEGEIKEYSADGDFAITVKDGKAIVIPMTGCFMGGGEIPLSTIINRCKNYGLEMPNL